MCARGAVALDEVGQSHLVGQFAECLAADQLRAGVGEETLALAFEVIEDDMSHGGIEDSIAQKLQPFVVQGFALVVALS